MLVQSLSEIENLGRVVKKKPGIVVVTEPAGFRRQLCPNGGRMPKKNLREGCSVCAEEDIRVS